VAPNINYYKRYAEGSFAPTAVRVGRGTNRTCSLRVSREWELAAAFENRAAGDQDVTRTWRSAR